MTPDSIDNNPVFWLAGPPIASAAILIGGLYARRFSPRSAWVLIVVGAAALLASAGWIALFAYIELVVGDT